MKRTRYNGKIKNRKSGRNKRGPKREFTEQQLEDVRSLTRAGARIQELAVYFDVGKSTVDYWLKNYREFRRARDLGKIEAINKVGNSLFEKANGYYVPALYFYKKKVKETEFDTEGNVIREIEYDQLEKEPYMKYFPKDANAAYKWLSINFKDVWADVTKYKHEHSGAIEHQFKKIEELPDHVLSEEDKKWLDSITNKQLMLGDGKSN
jgi:hypothetical protein